MRNLVQATGISGTAVSMAVQRTAARMDANAELAAALKSCQKLLQMGNVKVRPQTLNMRFVVQKMGTTSFFLVNPPHSVSLQQNSAPDGPVLLKGDQDCKQKG